MMHDWLEWSWEQLIRSKPNKHLDEWARLLDGMWFVRSFRGEEFCGKEF